MAYDCKKQLLSMRPDKERCEPPITVMGTGTELLAVKKTNILHWNSTCIINIAKQNGRCIFEN